MGNCKSCSLNVPIIDPKQEQIVLTEQDASLQNNISQKLSVSQSVGSELENSGNQQQINNNNKQQNQYDVGIRDATSEWKSLNSKKNQESNGLQNHIKDKKIDELSKNQFRIDTQPDDGLLGTYNLPSNLMLDSNQERMSKINPQLEGTKISHAMVQSNRSKPKVNIQKQSS
ncbi:unnamed protein product [Paramecium pentaurelia]|uniref:Uncharacterized protein n=1 Tax=Paramecium pentaurelia TaxID=43138 RepID=A0A8S1WVJ4_9CILI|nr:unnamed protein product [Paramecium pentaurelia]